MLQPGLSCGRCDACLSGATTSARATRCSATAIIDGGYAELVKVPVQNLIPIPDDDRLRRRRGVSADVPDRVAHADDARPAAARRDVLVLAAGSGVGQAAIQIAVLHGARVFATAGSDEKLERARALGATT